MKKQFVALIAFGLVLGACSPQGERSSLPTAPAPTVTADSPATVTLQFDTPIQLEQLEPLTRKHRFQVSDLRVDYPGFTVLYHVDGTLAAARADFEEKHREFLRHMSHQLSTPAGQMLPLNTKNSVAVARNDLESGHIPVSYISVTADAVPTLRGTRVRDDVMLSAPARPAPQVQQKEMTKPGAQPNSNSHPSYLWAPYGGSTDVSRVSYYQTFYFNHTELFNDKSIYEHAVQFYNINYADYGNYASTNMPNAFVYVQQNANNTGTMDEYPVGCANARLLANGTRYFTYMVLKQQSASSALCRIKGQLYVRAWWCPHWTCSDLAATTSPPLYTYNVPAGASWQY